MRLVWLGKKRPSLKLDANRVIAIRVAVPKRQRISVDRGGENEDVVQVICESIYGSCQELRMVASELPRRFYQPASTVGDLSEIVEVVIARQPEGLVVDDALQSGDGRVVEDRFGLTAIVPE